MKMQRCAEVALKTAFITCVSISLALVLHTSMAHGITTVDSSGIDALQGAVVSAEAGTTGDAENANDAQDLQPSPSPGEPGGPERPGPKPSDEDADAPTFSVQPAASHYAIAESGFEAPTYTVEAALPAGSAAEGLTLQWYVGGQPYGSPQAFTGESATSTITVSELEGSGCGVTGVYCKASCTLDGKLHTADSFTTNFIVCNGVKPNSVLTFSDVHEKWDAVGQAIEDTLAQEDGFIPALVVATGDYNNGYVAGFNEKFIQKCIDTMIERLELQLGRIDTVWVSGNHDNGYATGFTNANKQANLGLDEPNYYDVEGGISGTGIIFDSQAQNTSSESSLAQEGLVVIGVNYEDLGSLGAYEGSGNGRPADSSKIRYGNSSSPANTVYAHLNTALAKVAENYDGELVIISTHAGLHALGVDADSVASGVDADRGDSPDYSITDSDAVVELVNSYVERYGLNVVWLFGHDHSRGEKEFYKVPGDVITATVDSSAHTVKDITLKFSYAHAGYITSTINGHQVYSLLTYDDTGVVRNARVADGAQTPVKDLVDRNGSALFSNGLDFHQTYLTTHHEKQAEGEGAGNDNGVTDGSEADNEAAGSSDANHGSVSERQAASLPTTSDPIGILLAVLLCSVAVSSIVVFCRKWA